jgi:soluble lytic murein transglycosylase-like protein
VNVTPARLRTALSLLGACLCWGLPVSLGAQIERTTEKGGVIELSNRREAEKARAERKQREQEQQQPGQQAQPGQAPEQPAAPNVVMPAPGSADNGSRFDDPIREASQLYHLPEALIRAVIKAESNFDPRVVSPANAHGLMQLLPVVAERMLVTDIFDPRQNILGGARYLRVLANTFNGDLQLTLAAYNAGAGAVARHAGIPPYAETQNYVAKVLEYYQSYRG